MKTNECKKVLWDLIEKIRRTTYSRNFAFSALRMVFLKYALDNYIGASTREEMQQCVRAQKMFALRDCENGIETVIPVLQNIDKAFGFEQILSHPNTIDAYARELFGVDKMRQKKSASEEGFKELIALLGNLDLEETDDAFVGSSFVEAFFEAVELYSERNSFSAEYTTNPSISALAKAILKVEDKDRFLDFTSGTGMSTLEIVGEARPQILNVESDGIVAAIAAMLYIMKGHEKLQIQCADSLANVVKGMKGNKLFIDAPFAAKIAKTPENEYTDSSLAVLNRVIHDYLTSDGIAVVTLAGGTLFQMKTHAVSMREEMVNLGMVKGVISLPPLWNNTMINTNLLVLSKKEMPCWDIVFVDAVQAAKKNSNRNRANALSEELIEQIVLAVENKQTIEGFSRVVRTEEICKEDFNLTPATYIVYPKEEETITMEEIDAQLSELYRQLLQ